MIKKSAILIIILFSQISTFAQDNPDLKTTIEWIFSKLSNQSPPGGNPDIHYYYQYDFNYETCELISESAGTFIDKPDYRKSVIPLKHVNFKDIVFYPSAPSIELRINNGKDLINYTNIYDNGEPTEEFVNSNIILINDRSAIERIKNAFTHAIKLCGGKGEPF